jgi:uroporphyrin-3 C-methyltransferase
MSEHKEEQENQEHRSEPEESAAQESESEAETAPAPSEPATVDRSDPPARGGNALAWLALLLALAAGGLAGWQWWSARQGDDATALGARVGEQASAIQSQSRSLGDLRQRVDRLESSLEELATRLDERDFDPAVLRDRLQEQADAVADLRQQVEGASGRFDRTVSELRSSIEEAGADRADRIDESLAEARFHLALVEVAALLRLGQSRAELAADPAGAVAVYRQARSRLEGLEDGRVERLRQLVARELEALRSVETTDWADLTGRLAALEEQSAAWPLAGRDAQPAEPAGSSESSESREQDDGGWWSDIRSGLGGLVRISPREAAPLTPAAVESVRERLRLHLAAAQSAAARRSTDEMKRQLSAAGQLLEAHFDTSAEPVRRALEGIESAASVESPSLPELGDALAEAENRLAAS